VANDIPINEFGGALLLLLETRNAEAMETVYRSLPKGHAFKETVRAGLEKLQQAP
jgi:hypothetical protein